MTGSEHVHQWAAREVKVIAINKGGGRRPIQALEPQYHAPPAALAYLWTEGNVEFRRDAIGSQHLSGMSYREKFETPPAYCGA